MRRPPGRAREPAGGRTSRHLDAARVALVSLRLGGIACCRLHLATVLYNLRAAGRVWMFGAASASSRVKRGRRREERERWSLRFLTLVMVHREAAGAYLARNAITPTFAELLENCCKDMPDSLTPYLLYKLKEKFPAAAKTVEIPPEAIAWKPKDIKVYNKVQLTTYLEDLRWGPTTAAVLERVVRGWHQTNIPLMISNSSSCLPADRLPACLSRADDRSCLSVRRMRRRS